jgi:small subunit ribosomal protein S17
MVQQQQKGNRRVLIGEVVSDQMQKTVVVRVTHLIKHKLYHKYVKRQVSYQAHDEENEYRTGDRVQIVECRPLSKHKRWRVQRLLERPRRV